ncbi:MAG TPA: DinB family protein [Bacteroidia bacterium]|nr:DinB family protein [Bacteroidia bacterium]
MEYKLTEAIEILERTPIVVEQMLSGLSENWVINNEGPDTWSPYDVVGHLIHGEKTDWIPRMLIVLLDGGDKKFAPFDRFGQFTESKGKTLQQLIVEFKEIRKQSLDTLKSKKLTDADMSKTGIHPAFGTVTLKQLLAAWVVHDLAHITQIARVMAKQYSAEVGPWKAYLSVLSK